MADFINEVEEQLRSDRYRMLARRLLPWFLAALAAAIVGWLGVWGYNTWQGRNIGKASAAYDKAITALAQGDETGAYTTFEGIGKSGPAAYRTLALIQQGNIRLAANKSADATALYDAAAKVAPNAVFGDLARLKAALSMLDGAPYPQLNTRLTALIGDKKPFDLQAREALAMAKLEAGLTAQARGDFNALSLSLGVTESMRERARIAIELIDSGQAKVAGDVIKAAATLPPLRQPNFAGGGGGGPPSPNQAEPQSPPENTPENSSANAPGTAQ